MYQIELYTHTAHMHSLLCDDLVMFDENGYVYGAYVCICMCAIANYKNIAGQLATWYQGALTHATF